MNKRIAPLSLVFSLSISTIPILAMEAGEQDNTDYLSSFTLDSSNRHMLEEFLPYLTVQDQMRLATALQADKRNAAQAGAWRQLIKGTVDTQVKEAVDGHQNRNVGEEELYFPPDKLRAVIVDDTQTYPRRANDVQEKLQASKVDDGWLARTLKRMVIGRLIAGGQKPEEEDMQVAIASNEPKILKQLLDAGLEPKYRIMGGSPLKEAIMARPILQSDAVIRTLLDAGADPNEQYDSWYASTPFGDALSHREPKEVIKLLLDAGADSNSGTSWHRTPLGIARANGQADVEQLLLEAGARNPLLKRPAVKTGLGIAGLVGGVALVYWLGKKLIQSMIREGKRLKAEQAKDPEAYELRRILEQKLINKLVGAELIAIAGMATATAAAIGLDGLLPKVAASGGVAAATICGLSGFVGEMKRITREIQELNEYLAIKPEAANESESIPRKPDVDEPKEAASRWSLKRLFGWGKQTPNHATTAQEAL